MKDKNNQFYSGYRGKVRAERYLKDKMVEFT